jgi:hypothetical protein
LLSNISSSAQDTLHIQSKHFFVDEFRKLILVNQDFGVLSGTTQQHVYGTLKSDKIYYFPQVVSQIKTSISYIVTAENGDWYSLFFTRLPVVSIKSSDTIVDEPRVHALFTLTESNGFSLRSDIGIEYRGATSQMYPKKSYRIEFTTDSTLNTEKDVRLLGMRNDDDWNLQALYIEPLRSQNMVSFELWNELNTLYYKNQEPNAINGVRSEYVEVFTNGRYMGVFALGERIDRKQLQIRTFNGNIRGELYLGVDWHGAVMFDSIQPYDNSERYWAGYNKEYPSEITNWGNLYDLKDFVINSNDQVFKSQYAARFDENSALDYLLFINIARANDNRGKNMYVARYTTNSRYFYVPWDLDATFGMQWDGQRDSTNDWIIGNAFVFRLMEDCDDGSFAYKLKQRWNTLKATTLSHEHIMKKFEKYHNYLKSNGVFMREELAWEDYQYSEEHLHYTSDWLQKRIQNLDLRFNNLCIPVNNEHEEDGTTTLIFPNPAEDIITIKSNKKAEAQSIILYDLTGKQLMKQANISETNTISVKHLKPGYYFIKVGTQNPVKLIKH